MSATAESATSIPVRMKTMLRNDFPLDKIIEFPDEVAIIVYVNSHPMTAEKLWDSVYVPNPIADVAKFFANRKMAYGEIQKHIWTVISGCILKSGSKDMKKREKTRLDLQKLNESLKKEIDSLIFKSIQEMATPTPLIMTIILVQTVLEDLVVKATFMPSPDGSNRIIRHVQKL